MVLVLSQAIVRAQTPQAPSSVSASDREFTNRVEISWAAGADAVSYEVWRANEPVFEKAVLLGEANETTFSDVAWPPEQIYHYWVVAKNFAGSGPPGGPDAGSRSDVSAGETLWAYDADAADHGVLNCTPALAADGTIYVLSSGGRLLALNPDGSEKWVFDTGVVASIPDHYGNSPAVDVDGTVYFGWIDGQFYAVNPDGTRKWRTKLGESIWSSPALGADGHIYIGAEGGGFYAISRSGDRLWFIPAPGPNDAPPSIGADGTIYFAKRDRWENRIVAVNRAGKIKWEVDSEHSTYGGGVASSVVEGPFGVLYFMNQAAKLILLNRDGTKRADIDTNGNENTSYWASPVIGDDGTAGVPGTVYVPDSQRSLAALRPDLQSRWSLSGMLRHTSRTPAAGEGGVLYVIDSQNVVAIDDIGSELWRFRGLFSNWTSDYSSPKLHPRKILLAPIGGKLFAIRTKVGPANSPAPQHRIDLRNSGRSSHYGELPHMQWALPLEDGRVEVVAKAEVGSLCRLYRSHDLIEWTPLDAGESENQFIRYIDTEPNERAAFYIVRHVESGDLE